MVHEIYYSIYNEAIIGAVKVMGPNVIISNCRIEGDNPADTLLTCNHRTKVHNTILVGSPNGQHRGISVNATGIRLEKFKVLNIFSPNQQTNGIAGWEGTSDLIVEDGEVEAASQNIIFGGAYCGHEMLIPQDIIIRNMSLPKNPFWRNNPTIAVTNFFEVKNGKRIKFHNNSGKFCWSGGGQDGAAVVLTVRQDSPSYFCVVEDIDISNNDFDSANAGVVTLGVDDEHPDSPMALKDIQITSNVFRNMGFFEPNGRQFMLNSGSKNLHIGNNKVFAANGVMLNSIITFSNDNYKNEYMQFIANDVPEGSYGLIGDNGTLGKEAWNSYTKDSDFQHNIIRDQSGNYEYPQS